MGKLPLLVLCASLLLGQEVLAEVWFVPTLEKGQELWVKNPTSNDETVWMSPPQTGQTLEEDGFDLPAGGSFQFPAQKLQTNAWTQISSRAAHPLQIILKQNEVQTEVPQGRTSLRAEDAGSAEAVFVTNLNPLSQQGQIRLQALDHTWTTQDFTVGPYATIKYSPPATSFERLEVQGQTNLLAHTWWKNRIQLIPTAASPAYSWTSSDSTRFLLSDRMGTQSFVVEISDPKLIAQARAQIQNPQAFMARILMAGVQAGPAQTNQDLRNPLQGPWSWHVAKVYSFAEYAPEDCDGTPEFIEETMNNWFESGTRICFWGYQIKAELQSPSTTELAP